MPRLRSAHYGVVVSVAEETIPNLIGVWSRLDPEPPEDDQEDDPDAGPAEDESLTATPEDTAGAAESPADGDEEKPRTRSRLK